MSSDKAPNSPGEKNFQNASLEQELRSCLSQIESALRGLKFGNINVIVQDGVVVQIDRTEKVRLRNASRSSE